MQSNKISLGGQNQKHINAYLQYCELVGDDGGKMMTEQQFQAYKKNYPKLAENRLYTSWYNSTGLQCKVVGPSTKCFCDHLYKNHDFLEGKGGKIKCKTAGCKCPNFQYIPIYGSQDFKCNCKHSYQVHDTAKKTCKNCPCKGFASNWSCPCGQKFSTHKTVSEKKEAKQAKGQNVNKIGGGITSYSSMLDGADRFQHDLKNQIKKKGVKVTIQDLQIRSNPKLIEGETAAWDLYKQPLKWGK